MSEEESTPASIGVYASGLNPDAASAHLLAAVGGDGRLEVDSNPNPLRDELCGPLTSPVSGACTLTDDAGLGEIPDPAESASLRPWMRAD